MSVIIDPNFAFGPIKYRRIVHINYAPILSNKKENAIKKKLIYIILYSISSIIRILTCYTFPLRNRFPLRIKYFAHFSKRLIFHPIRAKAVY